MWTERIFIKRNLIQQSQNECISLKKNVQFFFQSDRDRENPEGDNRAYVCSSLRLVRSQGADPSREHLMILDWEVEHPRGREGGSASKNNDDVNWKNFHKEETNTTISKWMHSIGKKCVTFFQQIWEFSEYGVTFILG
jgi:hypothetical protein